MLQNLGCVQLAKGQLRGIPDPTGHNAGIYRYLRRTNLPYAPTVWILIIINKTKAFGTLIKQLTYHQKENKYDTYETTEK